MVKGNDKDKGKGKKIENDDGKGRRSKHEWTKQDVELLIKLLVEEAQLQLGGGGSLVGFQHRWSNITEKFNSKRDGLDEVDKAQLKNKGDTLKGGWRKWRDLTHKQTGLGWDEANNWCTYPPEWVARKAQENRAIHKLITSKWPADLVDQMELIWGQSYTNGELRITPGGTAPVEYENLDDDDDPYVVNDNKQDVFIDFSAGGQKEISADMSEGHNMNTISTVGSNRNRVSAPFTGVDGQSNAPFFDLTNAAAFGDTLTASAFQGSQFAGIVVGSSNAPMGFQPSAQQLNSSGTENKPQNLDELMMTTVGVVPHGGKRKQSSEVNEVKKKSKGSRGKSSALVDELKQLQTGVDETIARVDDMMRSVDAMEGPGFNHVILVQEAASIIRAIPGISRAELVYASMLLADRSHRAVLMTFVDEEEIAEWVRNIYRHDHTDQ